MSRRTDGVRVKIYDPVREQGGARGWLLVLFGTALLLALATLPPWVEGRGRALLMHGFSLVCHQLPGRSPHFDGVVLAVCHRCYGIYWGLPLAVLGSRLLRRQEAFLSRHARFFLPASLLPPGIDWLAGLLGFWTNTPLSRTLTGAVFGLVAGYFLTRAVAEAFAGSSRRPEPAVGEPYRSEPQRLNETL